MGENTKKNNFRLSYKKFDEDHDKLKYEELCDQYFLSYGEKNNSIFAPKNYF